MKLSIVTATRALVALALVGICRIAFFYFYAEPRHEPRRAPIDARYARLRALLPPAGEVGYLTDLPPATRVDEDGGSLGTQLYLHAQYALAPLVLRFGDVRSHIVIANVSDPARLPDLLDRNRLRLVAEAGPGLAVAAPR